MFRRDARQRLQAGQPHRDATRGVQHARTAATARSKSSLTTTWSNSVPMADLVARQLHAPGDLCRIVAGAAAQTALQRGQRRRQDEHADHVAGQCRAQLAMALPVDVEHHVLAGTQRLLHRRARRAVAMPAEHAGPFQQFARRDHAVELRLVAEVIVHAVGFAGTRRARRDADRTPQIRLARQQCIGDRGLAGTGRCGQHQTHAASCDGRH